MTRSDAAEMVDTEDLGSRKIDDLLGILQEQIESGEIIIENNLALPFAFAEMIPSVRLARKVPKINKEERMMNIMNEKYALEDDHHE